MTTDPLVSDYLTQLSRVTVGLDPAARAELLEEMRQHISDAQATGEDIPATLARLGNPEQIALAAGLPIGTTVRTGAQKAYDLATVFLLVAGSVGLPYLVGWFIGVTLLWNGPRWTIRDRLIGTLVPPFGATGLLALGPLTFNLGTVGCSEVGQDIVCERTLLPDWLSAALPVTYLILGAATGGFLLYRATQAGHHSR